MEYAEGELREADSSYEDLVNESNSKPLSNQASTSSGKRPMYSPHGVGLSPSLLATRPSQLRQRPSYPASQPMAKTASSSSSSNGKRNSIVSSSGTSADTAKDAADRSAESVTLSRSSSLSSAKQFRPRKGADLDGRNQRFINSVNAHLTSPPTSPEKEPITSPLDRVYSSNLRRSVSLSSPEDTIEGTPSRRSSLRTSEIREEARARRQRSSAEPEEVTSPSSGSEAFASKRSSVVPAYRHASRYSSPQAYDSPRLSSTNYSDSPRVERRSRPSEHYTPSRPASRADYHHYRSPEERPSTSMSFRSPDRYTETSPQTSQTISYSSNYNRQRTKTDSPTTRATNSTRARIPVEFLRRSEEPESPRDRSASPALSSTSRLTSVSRRNGEEERYRRESSASVSERGEYEEGRSRKRSLLSEQSSVSSQSNGSKDDIFGRTMHTPYGRSRSSTSPPSSILSSRHSQPRDDRTHGKGSSAKDWLSEVQELRERIGALEVNRPVSSASSRSSGRRSDRHKRSNATATPIREEHHRTIRPTTSHAVLSPHARQPTFSNHSMEDLSRSDSHRRSPQTGLGSPYATLREKPTPRTPGHPPLPPNGRNSTAEHQKLLIAAWERMEDYRRERSNDELPPEAFEQLLAMVEHTNALNSGLRQMVAATIDAQIEAELEEESGQAASGSTFVKLERTAADLQRTSDDQTRCLTDLLISLGRHVRVAQPRSPVQARVNGAEHSSGRKGENARAETRAGRQSVSLGLPESPRSAEARPGPKTSQSSQQTIRPMSSFISSPIARLARRASKSASVPTLSLAHATSPKKDSFRQDKRNASLDLDVDMVETPDTSFDLQEDRSPLARRESTSSFAITSLRNGLDTISRRDSRNSRAPSFS